MNKQELLQLVTSAKADAFSDMVTSIVETIADAIGRSFAKCEYRRR